MDKSDFEQIRQIVREEVSSQMDIFKEQAKKSFDIVFERLDKIEARLERLELRMVDLDDSMSVIKDLVIENQVKLGKHERRLGKLALGS